MNTPASIPWSAVTDSLAPAWQGMKARLFRPFVFSSWLTLGFTAWLSMIGQGGLNMDFSETLRDGKVSGTHLRALFHTHGGLLLGVAGLAVVVVIGLAVAMLWLRCRGRFMLLDNIVSSRADVTRPWHECAGIGHSLFRWSLVFWIVASLALVSGATLLGIGFGVAHRGGGAWRTAMPWLLAGVPWTLLAALAICYVMLFLDDFVVPLMHRHQLTATAAWQMWWPSLRRQAGLYFVYSLFRSALALGIMVALLVAGVLTCCCLFVLLVIPYVYAVVLLPVVVFSRLYSLEFLRHAGPAFDCLAPPAFAGDPPALPDETQR